MKKLYVYNLKRHTLHIEGLCPHTFKGMKYGENYKCFETEDDAIAFDGRAVSMCKRCAKKRDDIINGGKDG